jgi:hypothetical protein
MSQPLESHPQPLPPLPFLSCNEQNLKESEGQEIPFLQMFPFKETGGHNLQQFSK